MPSPVHYLTHPGNLTASAVVCGSTDAALATWDVTRVTCPGCTPHTKRARQPGRVSEKAFFETIRPVLTQQQFLWYHTYDSRRSVSGFPDLIALRGRRFWVAELKRVGGQLTPAQQIWLEAFRHIPGCEVYIWTPDDLPTIMEIVQ